MGISLPCCNKERLELPQCTCVIISIYTRCKAVKNEYYIFRWKIDVSTEKISKTQPQALFSPHAAGTTTVAMKYELNNEWSRIKVKLTWHLWLKWFINNEQINSKWWEFGLKKKKKKEILSLWIVSAIAKTSLHFNILYFIMGSRPQF